jgi:hypothetical protein
LEAHCPTGILFCFDAVISWLAAQRKFWGEGNSLGISQVRQLRV